MQTRVFRLLTMAAVAPLAALSIPASAQIVVDQSQTVNTSYMAGFGQSGLAQSFQPSFTNITGAEIFLRGDVGSGTGDITLDLYDKLPNAGGVLLGSGVAVGATPGSWAHADFGQIAVTPDTTYFLVFTSSNNTLGVAGSTSNPYSRGQTYANAGFGSFPSFDYTFQTFSNAGSVSAPEPGTLALLGLGIAGLSLRRRRK